MAYNVYILGHGFNCAVISCNADMLEGWVDLLYACMTIIASFCSMANNTYIPPPEEAWAGTEWKPIADGKEGIPLDFTMANMMEYFLVRKAIDGMPNNDFKNINKKAFPLFKAGHIQSVMYKSYCNDVILLKCKCHAEMKKAQVYFIKVVFDANDIVYAVCGCAAGAGPTCSCKHFGALCYFIEEYCRLKSDVLYSSCTSSLQTWHQPSRKRSSASSSKMDQIKFSKNEYGKVKREISTNYDPRPMEYKTTTSNEITLLYHQLQELPEPVALLHAMPVVPNNPSIRLPLVPCSIQMQIQSALMKEPQPVSLNCLYTHAMSFLDALTVSSENLKTIEESTREQHLKPRWHRKRHCRLISFNFGKFASQVKIINSLLYGGHDSKNSNSAIIWGQLHELSAFEEY